MTLNLHKRLAWCALALMSGLLGACGGGSSSDTADGGDTPAEASHWLAQPVSTSDSTQLLVWDPAAPTARQRLLTMDVAAAGNSWASTDAWTVTSGSTTRTRLGSTLAFYLADGVVKRVNLLGGRSHASVQVSSIANACGLGQVVATDASGESAWLEVRVRNASGQCQGRALVHSDFDLSTDALSWTSMNLLAALPDANGDAVALLASGPATGSGSSLYQVDASTGAASLLSEPDTGVTHDRKAYWLAADSGNTGAAFVWAGGSVRRLNWTDAGAVTLGSTALLAGYSVDRCLYATGCAARSDGDGGLVVWVDAALYRVAADGTTTTLGATDEGALETFEVTDTHAVWSTNESDNFKEVAYSVPLAGGTVTTLATVIVTGTEGYLRVAGTQGADVILSSKDNTDTTDYSYRYQRVAPDGSATVNLGGRALALVQSAAVRAGRTAEISRVLSCASSTTTCLNKTLTEITVADLGERTLGTLTSDVTWTGTLFDGLASALGVYGVYSWPVEVWQVTPGSSTALSAVF